MNKLPVNLGFAILLTACDNSSSSEADRQTQNDSTGLRVCKFAEVNQNDVLQRDLPIDASITPVTIDSFTQALSDYSSSVEISDPVNLRVSLTLSSVALANAFTLLTGVYRCDEERFQLNSCNYTLPDGDDGVVRVVTSADGNLNYSSVVTRGPTADQTNIPVLSISGNIKDAGNVTLILAGEGDDASEIEVVDTRNSNGFESLSYLTEGGEWLIQENADCSGSIDYQGSDEEGVTAISASWTFDGTTTTGSGTFNAPDLSGIFSW